MGRSEQFIGLSPAAKGFLVVNEVPEKVCKECKRTFSRDLEIVDHYIGMFNTEYPLFRHRLINGDHADEFLQAVPWFGGPMFFLGLRLHDLTELTWTEEEIERQSSPN